MTKKTTDSKTIVVKNVKEFTDKIKKATAKLKSDVERNYEIIGAQIKDDYCNYTFEIKSGVGIGDTHNVKGSGIVEGDMHEAFGKFNVHLACIDDVFKHSGIDFERIDEVAMHELTNTYHVTGFKIKGGKDNESIILIGSKHVSEAGGRIEIQTPKIPLDNFSSYKWYNELKEVADGARLEVALYKEGKYILADEPEPLPDPNQTALPLESDNDLENGIV